MSKKWLKRNIMVKDMCLFDGATMQNCQIQGKTCRKCVHRVRFELNEHSSKIIQCCELQPSKRSNSGYKTIKVTDMACINYKENE